MVRNQITQRQRLIIDLFLKKPNLIVYVTSSVNVRSGTYSLALFLITSLSFFLGF